MNGVARSAAVAGAGGRVCTWRALRTAGPGDGGDEQTPIGDPPDDDGGTEPDEDEDEDEDEEDDEPLQALAYCAAASPWATHRGTMASATQRRMPKP
jgi:hypothetical protein